jgi:hypothetical protein
VGQVLKPILDVAYGILYGSDQHLGRYEVKLIIDSKPPNHREACTASIETGFRIIAGIKLDK